ncbi:MAG: hypothetical protein HGA53_06580 [Anaerolineaceae bacterium]|nr:hypothetical protein [Anaerolineaceae bacterium]
MPVDELQHAVELVSAGHQDEAAVMLSRLVTQDPKNEAAWLWLSVCLNEKPRKIYCLEQVLKINPGNRKALQALSHLKDIPLPSVEAMTGAKRADFITLACPSCGAGLDVTGEEDRYRCSACGNEHLVRRDDGHVWLEPVLAQINRINERVSRSEAGLRAVQLQDEIEAEEKKLVNIRRLNYNAFYILLMAAVLFGSTMFIRFTLLVIMAFFLAFLGGGLFVYSFLSTRRIQQEIAQRRSVIANLTATLVEDTAY